MVPTPPLHAIPGPGSYVGAQDPEADGTTWPTALAPRACSQALFRSCLPTTWLHTLRYFWSLGSAIAFPTRDPAYP